MSYHYPIDDSFSGLFDSVLKILSQDFLISWKFSFTSGKAILLLPVTSPVPVHITCCFSTITIEFMWWSNV